MSGMLADSFFFRMNADSILLLGFTIRSWNFLWAAKTKLSAHPLQVIKSTLVVLTDVFFRYPSCNLQDAFSL
jgi:hypothetical protein